MYPRKDKLKKNKERCSAYHFTVPMTMEGMAAEKHPKAAQKERVLATLTLRADKTLWK